MKDFLGNEIVEGDYFAYSMLSGRAPVMSIFQFKGEYESGYVKARKVEHSPDHSYPFFRKTKWNGEAWVDKTPEELLHESLKTTTLQCFTTRALKIDYKE